MLKFPVFSRTVWTPNCRFVVIQHLQLPSVFRIQQRGFLELIEVKYTSHDTCWCFLQIIVSSGLAATIYSVVH